MEVTFAACNRGRDGGKPKQARLRTGATQPDTTRFQSPAEAWGPAASLTTPCHTNRLRVSHRAVSPTAANG